MHIMMDGLSWPDYARRIMDAEAIVLPPVGALAQHGPHLPLGTDALLAAALAQTVARQVDGIVAPPLSYGCRPEPKGVGGQRFAGAAGLDGVTLAAATCDILAQLGRHGARHVAVVSGHYENQWFLTEGIDLARRRLGTSSLRIMPLEYSDFLAETTLATVFPNGVPEFARDHAAMIETSLMLHYFPELVRMDALPGDPAVYFPPCDMAPAHPPWTPASGVLSSARGASAEKGSLMAEEICTRIAAALRREFRHG